LGIRARCAPTAAAGTVCLTVWDTGIGIPLEQQARLFDAFTQVDQTLTRPFEGVGIGLASAHQLVTLLGGRIAVQSDPGQGARFTVTLPVTPAGG
jgi:signal transduction histidine kinase